jgi:hypothetical protein
MTEAVLDNGLVQLDFTVKSQPLAEIEASLEKIVASVREIAARAEEHLRDAMSGGEGRRPANSDSLAISHIPFVIEASRLQISALHALMGQGQRFAA